MNLCEKCIHKDICKNYDVTKAECSNYILKERLISTKKIEAAAYRVIKKDIEYREDNNFAMEGIREFVDGVSTVIEEIGKKIDI